jgi:DNA-binding NtrC family response regulator
MMKKSPRLHVLIVDDESLIRWSIAETLAHEGYEVTEAGDAREAVQRVSRAPAPDVILLDYRLPDSNDLKLLETIRGALPNSPVIMMTAYRTTEVVDGAIRLGAYRVLSKPVELSDLIPLVERAYQTRTP